MTDEPKKKKQKKQQQSAHRPHKFVHNSNEKKLPLFKQSMPPALLAAIMKRPQNVAEAVSNEDCPIETAAYYFCIAAEEAEMELRENPFFIKHNENRLSQRFADRRLLLAVEKMFVDRNLQILNKLQELQDEENRYGSLEQKQQKLMDMVQNSMAKLSRLQNFSQQHSAGELFTTICEESMKPIVQTLFFLLLTHSVKIREIVCQQSHCLRFPTHCQFANVAFVNNFFENLTNLTHNYVAFELSEIEYVSKVHYLARTGTTLQIIR